MVSLGLPRRGRARSRARRAPPRYPSRRRVLARKVTGRVEILPRATRGIARDALDRAPRETGRGGFGSPAIDGNEMYGTSDGGARAGGTLTR